MWDARECECRCSVDGQSDTIRTVMFSFLKQASVLSHVTLIQQLRNPELLSVTCRNTAPQRHPLLWEKRVMIYIQYHKG
jgi:hypothetical protein